MPTRADLLPALRVGISVLTPLVLVTVTGHLAWSLYVVCGAFAAIYGRTASHPHRFSMQTTAGLLVVASVTGGVAISALTGGTWPAVVGVAVVAAVASVVSDWFPLRPPGSLFPVFSFGAAAAVPASLPDVPVAFAVATGAALFSVLVGAAGASVPAIRRVDPPPPREQVVRRHSGMNATANAVAAGLAASVAILIDPAHAWWASVAAVVPLSAADTPDQLSKAWHRLLGTCVGLVLTAALLATQPGAYATIAMVGVLQVATELFVLRHYATAMVFVTPMALLMAHLANPGPTGPLMLSRALTTAVGVGIGALVVVCVHGIRERD